MHPPVKGTIRRATTQADGKPYPADVSDMLLDQLLRDTLPGALTLCWLLKGATINILHDQQEIVCAGIIDYLHDS